MEPVLVLVEREQGARREVLRLLAQCGARSARRVRRVVERDAAHLGRGRSQWRDTERALDVRATRGTRPGDGRRQCAR